MDYEKKYNEALERASIIYTGRYKPADAAVIKEVLETVFPEITEDEKIRKGLINYLFSCR